MGVDLEFYVTKPSRSKATFKARVRDGVLYHSSVSAWIRAKWDVCQVAEPGVDAGGGKIRNPPRTSSISGVATPPLPRSWDKIWRPFLSSKEQRNKATFESVDAPMRDVGYVCRSTWRHMQARAVWQPVCQLIELDRLIFACKRGHRKTWQQVASLFFFTAVIMSFAPLSMRPRVNDSGERKTYFKNVICVASFNVLIRLVCTEKCLD